jgi:hypothetical protein
MLLVAILGLYATYLVGIGVEFTARIEDRLPPFCPKKLDLKKPAFGWLGSGFHHTFRMRYSRVIITLIMAVAGRAFTVFLVWSFVTADPDNIRGLPKEETQNQLLLWVGVFCSILSLIPVAMVQMAAVPGLFKDWLNFKKASRSYQTGAFDICEIDEDIQLDSELRKKQCLPLTIVLPCYMPTEEDILEQMIDFYKEQSKYYPGELKVLIVWNSPNEHPEIQDLLDKKCAEWPGLKVDRHPSSTSKCDNLNMALQLDLIDTEMCCLNDADTMVHWGAMVRASVHIGEEGYDIAQAMNTHSKDDRNGTPEGSGWHPFGALITIGDSTKPANMSTQGIFGHVPFNGRGGFWRTSALKQVGFDHRTVGEDHDAAYRGCAYFGFRGILDVNMLCQEQEPPSCKALTGQRIRWETCALEMRRTFNWVLRSPFYSRFEAFVLLWSQLGAGVNMPFQCLPFQVAVALPIVVLKGLLVKYMFGDADVLDFSLSHLCKRDGCVFDFVITMPSGHKVGVAMNLAMVIAAAVLFAMVLLYAIDLVLRVSILRYRPRIAFCCHFSIFQYIIMVPFFVYVQFWALYDYSWGGAKFIATARTPSSSSLASLGSRTSLSSHGSNNPSSSDIASLGLPDCSKNTLTQPLL